ncbi:MAG: ribosome silencing factor [Kiritimatiellae bacterium]|nr:ribosome silencing factor [Kiritimatiellia bacterium]
MSEDQIKLIVQGLKDRKGTDIKVYDVRGKSQLADYFIVATGAAAPHLKALIAETQSVMKDAGVMSYRTSGDPESGWIVVDYIDAIVHVFSAEARAYYALEKLWEKL